MSLFRTKSLAAFLPGEGEPQLARTLTATNLVLLGIGAIIGAGIFVLTGTAAAQYAGPAIALSFILAGGRWDLTDPAQVRRLVRHELLVGVLAPEALAAE